MAFNGDAALALAGQFLELAEKQRASVPLSMGHGIMGFSLLVTGNFTQSLRQTDQALALYNPAVHRPLTMLFGGQDMRVTNLTQRSLALWFLGYPDAALAGANQFLKEARQTDQVGTLFTALNFSIVVISFVERTQLPTRWLMSLSLWRTNKMLRCGNQSDWRTEVGF